MTLTVVRWVIEWITFVRDALLCGCFVVAAMQRDIYYVLLLTNLHDSHTVLLRLFTKANFTMKMFTVHFSFTSSTFYLSNFFKVFFTFTEVIIA